MGTDCATVVLGGGDTGRVADCGRASSFFSLFVGFVAVGLGLATFVAGPALAFPADKPVKTVFGVVRAAGGLLEASFFVWLIFWRFAAGSSSLMALVAGIGCEVSSLKES